MGSYVSKRTKASQMFDYEELMAILDIGARRPIIEEKRLMKLIDYSLAEGWLKELGIDVDPFSDENDIQQIIEKGNKSKETIGPLTLDKIKSGDENFLTLMKKITGYLGQEDVPEISDFIFVFGGKNLGRIQKAVELWKAGWAPKIWISGGHPVYLEYEPEALIFKRWATENGVPESAILVEPDSVTVADNVRRSLNLMDKLKVEIKKMIMVISWYVQKRAWMTMEKYVPAGTKLINVNAWTEPDSPVSPTKWFESDYGINIIFNEFLKMRVHDCLVMSRTI